MDNVAVFKAVLPKNTVKQISDLMNVPLNTAHEWLYRHFSPARARELARVILARWDAEDALRAACRQHLEQLVNGHDQVGSDRGITDPAEAGRKEVGAETDGLRGSVADAVARKVAR